MVTMERASEGGVFGTIRTRGIRHNRFLSISLIPLWLSPVNRPGSLRTREKGGDESDPPQKKPGGHVTLDSGAVFHASIPAPWGRSRPHLSLREGSETAPQERR